MASVRYVLKTNSKWNSIYIRLKHDGGKDRLISTGIKVPKNKFSKSLQRINYTDEVDVDDLNDKLRNLKTHILNKYSSDSLGSTVIDNKWLKLNVDSFFNRITNESKEDEKHFLYSYMTTYIEAAKKRIDNLNNPIDNRTVQHYETTQRKLKAFETYKGKLVRLTDVNLQFREEFIEYLENEQMLNPNTIGGYLNVIKRVCRKADFQGYDVNNSYKSPDFKAPSNEALDTYLTIEEINKIYNHKFTKDYLDNARDWLIVGVWTGFRVSDLLSLTKDDITKDGLIFKETIKTKKPVYVPILGQVKNILDKRDGNFPRHISDQKFNDYIKIVCKEAGINSEIKGSKMCEIEVERKNGVKDIIHRKKTDFYPKWELVSSHICRRSFATNHYGKLDTMTIMNVTGHKTESQFLKYIKVTPKEHAERIREYWKNRTVNG
ncbi:MAG: site-specific integrase [Flavobacteriaceae bacterium]|nr:phage integrase SAM-like domain-containing protein [Flavobacteriaceae bacterium]